MLRLCAGAIVWLAVLVGESSSATAHHLGDHDVQTMTPQTPRTIRVRVLDGVGLSDDVQEVLAQQVSDVWSSRGVYVDRSRSDSQDVVRRTVYVLIRRRTPADKALAERRAELEGSDLREGPIGLAWIAFNERTPSPVIFVSMEHTKQLLSAFTYDGRLVDRCPPILYRQLLGRALGRIVAHEIGHYLNGPSHAAAGLMKPVLTDTDLLASAIPSISSAR
jgi:hypothetical protein